MTLALAALVTAWHCFLARQAVTALRQKSAPRPFEFALGSFIIYYDLGLWLEALGIRYSAPGFVPFLDTSPGIRAAVYVSLMVAPAILFLAARTARSGPGPWKLGPRRSLSSRQERSFLLVFGVVALVAMGLSVSALVAGGSVPAGRLTISNWLGSAAILLYVPLDLSAYFSMTSNARGRRGLALSLALSSASALSLLALGQRTLILMPFLILAVTRIRFRALTFGIAAVAGLALVVGLGLVFKPEGVVGSENASVVTTVNQSLSRAPVAASAMEYSRPAGTSVMAYPGEGYVYAVLFFVPHQLAPFKGESTAQRFTDAVEGPQRKGRWGFGVGMVEEAVLNVGWAVAVLPVAAIGFALGAAERLVTRRVALVIPVCGAAVWLCGYHLPAILMLFGSMFLVVLAADIVLFGRQRDPAPPSRETSGLLGRDAEES